jgi:hypothetical protein
MLGEEYGGATQQSQCAQNGVIGSGASAPTVGSEGCLVAIRFRFFRIGDAAVGASQQLIFQLPHATGSRKVRYAQEAALRDTSLGVVDECKYELRARAAANDSA